MLGVNFDFDLQFLYQDEVLSSMQQKLDNLCEQLYSAKDQPGSGAKILEKLDEAFCSDKNVHFLDCGCLLCDQHVDLSSLLKVRLSIMYKVKT